LERGAEGEARGGGEHEPAAVAGEGVEGGDEGGIAEGSPLLDAFLGVADAAEREGVPEEEEEQEQEVPLAAEEGVGPPEEGEANEPADGEGERGGLGDGDGPRGGEAEEAREREMDGVAEAVDGISEPEGNAGDVAAPGRKPPGERGPLVRRMVG
jgi:hypothetical protein